MKNKKCQNFTLKFKNLPFQPFKNRWHTISELQDRIIKKLNILCQ